MKINYSSKFKRVFKKLPLEIKELFFKKLELFEQDPFAPQLKTHRLQGIFQDYYAFSLNYSDRVIFKISKNPKEIQLLNIGSHKIYEI